MEGDIFENQNHAFEVELYENQNYACMLTVVGEDSTTFMK